MAIARIDVGTNGFVSLIQDCVSVATGCSTNGAGYVSLEGIAFRTDG